MSAVCESCGRRLNKMDTTHRQVPAVYNDDELIMVDERLATILELLWDHGYETITSCQNQNGYTVIEFEIDSFQSLARLAYSEVVRDGNVARNEQTSLYKFMSCVCDRTNEVYDNGYVDRITHDWVNGNKLIFSVSVRFKCDRLDEFETLIIDAHL